jgi:tRNA pseudouridine38-40 synthase
MVLDSRRGAEVTVNIKMLIEYDGAAYYGWQRQKNKPTVQQTIEESLQILLQGEKISLLGAGRTDSGVHARGQCANFRISKDLFKKLDLHKLAYRLNSLLPSDITIHQLKKVPDAFHARYSAKKRVYRYLITLAKRSYSAEKYYYHKGSFDILAAKEFCKVVEGIHSFKSMCKNDEDGHNFESNVFYAKLKKKKDSVIEFEICANRFLHSMVRAMLGAMLGIASGKMSIKEFKQKFQKGEPILIQYVPANALILEKIIY